MRNKYGVKIYGFIYLTTNLVNGKKYIGQHIISNTKRDETYLGSGTYLIKAIKKYGKENFKREIIDTAVSKDELDFLEAWHIYIRKADKSKDYYNVAPGWSGTGYEGKNNPMYGKNPWLNKTKEEMEQIAKSKSEKMKIRHKGKNNPFYGRKHSQEFSKLQSERMSGVKNPRAKKVKIILNNEEKIYGCLKECMEDLDTTAICKFINTGKPFTTRYKRLKHLEGMIIQYL